MRFIDLTGRRFAQLTVTSRAANRGHHLYWDCLCDCGQSTTVKSDHLKSGRISTCGKLADNQWSIEQLEQLAQDLDQIIDDFNEVMLWLNS